MSRSYGRRADPHEPRPYIRLGTTMEHAKAAAHLIAEAFDPLPATHWLAGPEPIQRSLIMRDYAQILTEHAIFSGLGKVMFAGDLAVAVWFDHTGPVVEPDQFDKRLAEAVGEHRLPRFQQLGYRLDQHHPKDPHWYLAFLAVSSVVQGRGMGSALLAEQTELLDEMGQRAYLEATGISERTAFEKRIQYKPDNRELYKKFDFQPMPNKIQITDDIEFTPMWRKPRCTS